MNLTFLSQRFRFSDTVKEGITIVIRYLCLFLFIYTAYAKTIDHTRFLLGLTRVHLISDYAEMISFLVPAVEIIVGVLLIIPKTFKSGLIGFIGVMTVFTGYIISAMIWEPKLPCHCGGAIEKLSWMQHIWFNLAYIFLAWIGLWLSKPIDSLKN